MQVPLSRLDRSRCLCYTESISRKEIRGMRWVQNGLILHFLGCDMAVHRTSAPFFR